MHKRTVLIIDDSMFILEALSELFRLEGLMVLEADDGDVGINLARTFLPDVIFCDVTLPGMDGYAVFKALREDDQTAQIAFFFMSGHPEHAINPVWREANGFIGKPFDIPQIFERLATLFENQ
jgi:CheY-like chemotaxis protein